MSVQNLDNFDTLSRSRKEAKLKSESSYFTGKPCKSGHISPRRTHNGECRMCAHIYDRKYKNNNREVLRDRRYNYYIKNREQELIKMKMWQQTHRQYFKEYRKKQLLNIQFRIKKLLRGRLYQAITKKNKIISSIDMLGCSVKDFVLFIASKFKDGMSWENYGKWHIDHIRPCSSFDLADIAQQRECFNYTNLQPLWANENRAKGKKWIKIT